MARATKLNDLQLILLTTASQRDDGSLLPPPDGVGDQSARIRKVIPPLLRNALVEEVAVTDRAKFWREDGDALIGLVITDDGRCAIGIEVQATAGREPEKEDSDEGVVPIVARVDAIEPARREPRAGTKTQQVLTLLRRSEGATLPELVNATGWLPHTMRAALTGLRKKGHEIAKSKRGDQTCYSIEMAA